MGCSRSQEFCHVWCRGPSVSEVQWPCVKHIAQCLYPINPFFSPQISPPVLSRNLLLGSESQPALEPNLLPCFPEPFPPDMIGFHFFWHRPMNSTTVKSPKSFHHSEWNRKAEWLWCRHTELGPRFPVTWFVTLDQWFTSSSLTSSSVK